MHGIHRHWDLRNICIAYAAWTSPYVYNNAIRDGKLAAFKWLARRRAGPSSRGLRQLSYIASPIWAAWQSGDHSDLRAVQKELKLDGKDVEHVDLIWHILACRHAHMLRVLRVNFGVTARRVAHYIPALVPMHEAPNEATWNELLRFKNAVVILRAYRRCLVSCSEQTRVYFQYNWILEKIAERTIPLRG